MPAPAPPGREAILAPSALPDGILRKTFVVGVGAWDGARLIAKDLLLPTREIPGARVIAKRGPRTVVRLPAESIQGPRGPRAPASLILKEEVYPFPALLRGIFAPPRALLELRNLVELRSLGFPAVEPFLCGWASLAGLHLRSFLLLEDFAGSMSLKDWWRTGCPGIPREELAAALPGFLRHVARLHAAGVSLGTLYGKNVLVRRGAGGEVELRLCDVPRARRPERPHFRFGDAAHDLACLDKWACDALDPSTRLELLDGYLRDLGAGPPREAWVEAIGRRRERLRHATPAGRASRGWKKLLKRAGLKRYWPF